MKLHNLVRSRYIRYKSIPEGALCKSDAWHPQPRLEQRGADPGPEKLLLKQDQAFKMLIPSDELSNNAEKTF